MFGLRTQERLIVLIILVLFGSSKTPEMMKVLGKGMQDDPENAKVESTAADPALAGRNGNKT